MKPLTVLLFIALSATAAPISKSPPEDSNNLDLLRKLVKKRESSRESSESEDIKPPKTSKKGRMHKAFFLSYPFVPQMNNYPAVPSTEETYNDIAEERTPGHRKKYQDSEIFYIRLPPSPYYFVPGLGYISTPPKYSLPGGQSSPKPQNPKPQSHPNKRKRPHTTPKPNPFINLPIDFVSNGKPTGVYQYESTKKPPKRKDTSISKLRKGPYTFNGRPTSIYLLGADGKPKDRQPIIYSDVNSNNVY
uniref:DUF4794 domain-containing protein n=1 Tax=Bracon brevicornis TaxID=1563983 RepID=A0A6V7JZB9_9HYME